MNSKEVGRAHFRTAILQLLCQASPFLGAIPEFPCNGLASHDDPRPIDVLHLVPIIVKYSQRKHFELTQVSSAILCAPGITSAPCRPVGLG